MTWPRPASSTRWCWTCGATWSGTDGHVAGAVQIPFGELPRRAGGIPPGEVWVYCRGGYRSTVAASVLGGRGRRVIGIDDEFGHTEGAGLTLIRNGG